MVQGFLSLPLQLQDIPGKGNLQRCTIKQSIAHHLHLIVTTSLGELAGNESFGCGLWESDFDNLTSRSKLKDGLVQSLTDAVKTHEPRLTQVRAEVQVFEEELTAGESHRRIKKRLDITVTGLMTGTEEPIIYKDHFFISPLSYN
jgi:predicted component of type VI protein secretion system